MSNPIDASILNETNRSTILNEFRNMLCDFDIDKLEELKLKKKKKSKESTKLQKCIPKFKFKSGADSACLSVDSKDRTPLLLSDIQSLMLFISQRCSSLYVPRWCHVQKSSYLKQSVLVFIENLSLSHFTKNIELFPRTNGIFKRPFEILTPTKYLGDLIEEFCTVPLTSSQKSLYTNKRYNKKLLKVHTTIKELFPTEEAINLKKSIEPICNQSSQEDRYPRTCLLLSAAQLAEHGYPLPLSSELYEKYSSYVMTSDMYREVTPFSPMYAIDCEMCLTTAYENELTRISVVDEKHNLIYEKLVKPHNKIINYLTEFSGITPWMLKNVWTRLEDVQKDIRKLLPPDAILVGQSLNSDLHAMKMMHPYIIDSSVIYNLTGVRYRKSKLKLLSEKFLNEKIQCSSNGHNSIEDSLSALKLIQHKLQRSISHGDAVLLKTIDSNEDNTYKGTSILHYVVKNKRTLAIICKDNIIKDYQRFIEKEFSESRRITFYRKSSNKYVFKSYEESKNNNLTILHCRLSSTELNEENIAKTCSKVDKWVNKTWNNMNHNSLCSVIFSGEPQESGICFVKTKEEHLVQSL